AEVGDPGNAPVLVHQHVVEREVAVLDLGGKEVIARQDALLVAVEHALDDLPPAGFGDRRHERTEPRRLSWIPEEVAPRSRVEERAQRQREAGVRGSELADRVVVEVAGARAARHALEEADAM